MIGDNIKKIRESKSIGVNELARIADVNASYISAIERNEKNNPSIKILNKIASALGVSMDEFFKPEPASAEKSKCYEEIADRLKKEEVIGLARDMNDLNDSDQEILKTLIKTMRKRGRDAQ